MTAIFYFLLAALALGLGLALQPVSRKRPVIGRFFTWLCIAIAIVMVVLAVRAL
jgi:hypothetical protein